jgi:glycerophosphoryl diester phosphodiesterase
VLRIGHKGADAIRTGNTLESFAAAVEAGVDLIELDVLRPREDFARPEDWRDALAGPVAAPGGPLLVAHDWVDARRRRPLTLAETLDAFCAPPLDAVAFDLDLKIAGREDEVVSAIRERGLTERAMISTMELSSLRLLAELAPELRRGWTLPKVRRDWSRARWARLLVLAGSTSLRARLPRLIRRGAPGLGVWAVWVYDPLITRRVVAAAHGAGVAVIAWTVDDLGRIRRLTELGVDGICTNDPHLLRGQLARGQVAH